MEKVLSGIALPRTAWGDTRVLEETDDLFALYKPAGIHSVGIPKDGAPSIADSLLSGVPSLGDASVKRTDGGLVHRLDSMTSGVLIGAKNPAAWKSVHAQFQDERAKKYYLAVLEGNLRSPITVTAWLGARYRGSKKVTLRDLNLTDRKPDRCARTESHFTPVMFGASPEFNYTVTRVELKSGARHQIRAHAAHLGFPLVGDSLYGATTTLPSDYPEFLLHCESIGLSDSTGRHRLTFKCKVPSYWEKLDSRLTESGKTQT